MDDRVNQVRVMRDVLGLNFREIGEHFGVCRQRAHQLYRRAYGLPYQEKTAGNPHPASPNFRRGDLVVLSERGRHHFGRDLGVRVVTRNSYGRTVAVACSRDATEGTRFAASLWQRYAD